LPDSGNKNSILVQTAHFSVQKYLFVKSGWIYRTIRYKNIWKKYDYLHMIRMMYLVGVLVILLVKYIEQRYNIVIRKDV